MLLSVVSRPRYGPDGELFDGKLGIWAFTSKLLPYSLVNEGRPSLETKEVSVTKTAYREKLISDVLPSLCARLPTHDRVVIPSDSEFAAAVERSDMQVE
ncbi:hypothetical protein PR002_g9225 [Phytophthora rubi]|uniref:Uncharacterized protein n=1 Tax=Phytophthora rubi TaxID=129364 RepID=A0A6A3MLP9_9STRA|nr:hypothetical protein PR002_g9225 [Phytophthora rubi]